MKNFIQLSIVFFVCFPIQIFCEEDSSDKNSYAPLKIFAESLHYIEENYPQKVNRNQLMEGAVRGMLSQIDPYSYFMDHKEAQRFLRQNQSHFGGVGIEAAFQNNNLVVTSVFKNSGAGVAGLQAGDVITHINGQSLKGLSFDLAAEKMKGKTGDILRLTVKRLKVIKPILFSVRLGTVYIPSVEGKELSGGIFYMKISSFRESTFKEVRQVLNIKKCTPQKRSCSKVKKGLLLDLRQNSGGVVDQALLVADLFVPEGVLSSMKGKKAKYNRIFYAKQIGSVTYFPILVLIDEYSASSSEILTAALQDNGRAFIVGKKSFGKGSIQTVFHLDQGYALKLTIAHYYTPKGRLIDKKGVLPDISVVDHYDKLKANNKLKAEDQNKIFQFKQQFYNQYLKSGEALAPKAQASQLVVQSSDDLTLLSSDLEEFKEKDFVLYTAFGILNSML